MYRMSRLTKLITCLLCVCVLFVNTYDVKASSEGGTVIINGNEEETGNKVIIIAPTDVPTVTATPEVVANGTEGTATIDISGVNATAEPTVSPVDGDTGDDNVPVNNKPKASKKPKATKKPVKASNNNADNKEPEDDIPKTGVVRWEIIFIAAGIVLLLAGSVLSVRYIRNERD